MNKILPVILALIGLAIGAGGGFALRPEPVAGGDSPDPAEGEAQAGTEPDAPSTEPDDTSEKGLPEYVKLSNQFVIPIVVDGRVASLVVMSLGLEVSAGSTDAIFAMEPKLRDRFLQILFDHANSGGFQGSFTDGANLIGLRRALLEEARQAAGDVVIDILISDIARQDN